MFYWMPAQFSGNSQWESGYRIFFFRYPLSYCLIHWTFFLSLDFSIHLWMIFYIKFSSLRGFLNFYDLLALLPFSSITLSLIEIFLNYTFSSYNWSAFCLIIFYRPSSYFFISESFSLLTVHELFLLFHLSTLYKWNETSASGGLTSFFLFFIHSYSFHFFFLFSFDIFSIIQPCRFVNTFFYFSLIILFIS